MAEDEELAKIRAQRQAEIERQAIAKQQQEEARAQVELQKQRLLAMYLTDDARNRLQNIKLANQEYAESIENQILRIGQSGQLRGSKITDEQLKQMLRQLMATRKETKINIQRK